MSFINYDNIIEYVQAKIDDIDTLSNSEASLVAAMANLLAGRNNPPANMDDLKDYLQGKENLVTDASLVKDVTLLLGASLPSKNTVWKMQEFVVNGTFTVPDNIAGGVVYVTGSGGGGSGAAAIRQGAARLVAMGGFSGQFCIKRPFPAVAGAAIPVVVGGGGAAVVASGAALLSVSGNDGVDSSFGSLVLAGGSGGRTNQTMYTYAKYGGGFPGFAIADIANTVTSVQPPNTVNGFHGGVSSYNQSGQPTTATGGGAGAFGDGSNGFVTVDADAAANSPSGNSGAGGGSACVSVTTTDPRTATSGAGGSGRIIVEWQEFV